MKRLEAFIMSLIIFLSLTALNPSVCAQTDDDSASTKIDQIEKQIPKTVDEINNSLKSELEEIKNKTNNSKELDRIKNLTDKLELPSEFKTLRNSTNEIVESTKISLILTSISCLILIVASSFTMWIINRKFVQDTIGRISSIEQKSNHLSSLISDAKTSIAKLSNSLHSVGEKQDNIVEQLKKVQPVSDNFSKSNDTGQILTNRHSEDFERGQAESKRTEEGLRQKIAGLESTMSELTASIDILRESESMLKQNVDSRDRELEESVKLCQAAYQASIRNGLVPELPYKAEELNSLLSSLTSQAASSIISVEGESLNESVNTQAKNIGILFASAVSGETRSAQRLLDPIPLNAYEFSREFWNDSLIAKNKLELAKHIALNLLTSHGYQLIQPVPGIDTISMQFHDERSQIETFDPKLVGKIASVRAPGLTFNGEIIRKAFVVQYVQGSGTPNAPIQIPIIPDNAPQTVSQQISTMNEGGQLSTPEVQTAPFEQNPIDNLILSRTAVDSTPDVPELPQESVQPNSLQDVQAPSNITEITNQSDYQGESNATVMPNELKVEESHPTYSSPLFSDIEAPNSEEDFN
jgi:hypothetical protein